MLTALTALTALLALFASYLLEPGPLSTRERVCAALDSLDPTVLASGLFTTLSDAARGALAALQLFALHVAGRRTSQDISIALHITGSVVLLCLSLALVLLLWYRLQLRLTPPSSAYVPCDLDALLVASESTTDFRWEMPQLRTDAPEEPLLFTAKNEESASEEPLTPPVNADESDYAEECDYAEDLAPLPLASPNWSCDLLPPLETWGESCSDGETGVDDEQLVFQLLSKRTRTRPVRRNGGPWVSKSRLYRDVKTDASRDEALW